MDLGNWDDVNSELEKLYSEIFKNVNVYNLDTYTKRKMIFEYLCNNIQYDYDMLEKIKLNKLNLDYRVERDPYKEIESIFKYKKGICNAISQVYKLLLEKVGIYSLCVICDDGTEINHQLNLVYDGVNDAFSFDDITSVIVDRGNLETFFDYDMQDANEYNQGGKPIYKKECWLCLPTVYIYYIVGKKIRNNLNYNIKSLNETEIPKNIVSYKKITKHL